VLSQLSRSVDNRGPASQTFCIDREAEISFAPSNEWTLIARFSNGDSKNWIADGSFWYDRVTPYGDVNNPLDNLDMISAAFWELKGSEIKITRSDDSTHTALLQTTSNCLQGGLICVYIHKGVSHKNWDIAENISFHKFD
jgi:hypothetical protein